MMSIFSPRSSDTTMRTREPLGPTHAPTGSTPCACDSTAIFERYPGSRATPRISTRPSAISGTSSSNSVLISSGSRRETITWGPFVPERLHRILNEVQDHGALLLSRDDVATAPAPCDGALPDDFYSTTNLPTQVRLGGRW